MNVSLVTKKMKIAMNVTSYLELANQLNISLPTIDSWKKRNAIPNKYLLKVSEDTGVSIDWLLSEDKPTFHISGGNILNSSSLNKDTNIDNELLPLFEALSKVAIALDKKAELKEELIKLISKLPTL